MSGFEELSEIDEARERLANALRAVSHGVIGHDPDPAHLHDLAAALEAAMPAIDASPSRARLTEGWGDRVNQPKPADGDSLTSYTLRPFYGVGNPYGLPYDPHVDGGDAVATVTLGEAFEGAPGRSHGGVVAALFDDLMGFVLSVESLIGFTGHLKIIYRGGVPIGEPVEYRCRLVEKDGRKLSMTGEARHGDDVLIEAEALFIEIDPEWFAANFPSATGSPGPAN